MILNLNVEGTTEEGLPQGSKDIEQGYVLLQAREEEAHPLWDCKGKALCDFLSISLSTSKIHVCQWTTVLSMVLEVWWATKKKGQDHNYCIVNDNTHFTKPLPEPKAHIDDNGKFLNVIPTDANYFTEMSQSNSNVQCVEDNASSTHHGVALKDPLCVMHHSITIPLMSEISSSNIFSQPALQFQVLKSVLMSFNNQDPLLINTTPARSPTLWLLRTWIRPQTLTLIC